MRNELKYIDSFSKHRYELENLKKYYSKRKLNVISENNATILPVRSDSNSKASKGAGGVIDSNGHYIESSAQLAFGMKDRVYGAYDVEGKVEYIDEEVVYLNYFYKHWGHFIIDIVSRMWFLFNNEKKYKVVFTTDFEKNETINGPFLDFLILFGIPKENIIILNKPTQFKKVIIPDVSIYPGKYYTKEYKDIFDHVVKNTNLNKEVPSKIYLSRANFKKASVKERGEREIEGFFNDNGYVSIIPEQLTLEEQIQYYYLADEIVCLSGTLPHNLVFSKDSQKIIILNKTYKLNKNQELINQVKKAKVTYIDIHISIFPIAYGKGPFILKLNNNLKRFAIERNYKFKLNHIYKIKNIYKKIWYLFVYFKTYHKVYEDKGIDQKKLWRYYIFK